MAKIKPILFNTEMARATLENRKTVTRRAPFQTEGDFTILKGTYFDPDDRLCALFHKLDDSSSCMPFYAPYQPGDILYVRETWTTLLGSYIYKADQKPGFKNPGKWRPSIHMPREAVRIFLRVTDVQVERLQKITPEQIDAEGCKEWAHSAKTGELLPSGPSWFKIAWNKTIKPKDRALYGWEANPWVWVIEFERCEKPEERKVIANA